VYSSALINRRKHDSEACLTLYTNKYNLPTSHQGRLQFTPHTRVSENVKKLVVCNKPNYFCVFVIAIWWWTPSNISISSCSLVINPSSNTHSILSNTHVHKALCYTRQIAPWIPDACSWARRTQVQDWCKHVTSVCVHHHMWRHTLSSFPSEYSRHSLKIEKEEC